MPRIRSWRASFTIAKSRKSTSRSSGALVQQRKRIDIPIGRDTVHREKISTRARRARSAVTRVTWARHVPGLSLLRIAIATGRTHQIRVHLNAIGHPIVGDALYGGVHRRDAAELARRFSG